MFQNGSMSGCSLTQIIPFSYCHDAGLSAVGIEEESWEARAVQEQQFLAGSGVTVDP